MTIIKNIIFFSVLLCAIHANAQQKMLLLNGNEIEIKSYLVVGEDVTYKKTNDKRDKLKTIDKYDVFSVTKEDGTEDIVYKSDSLTFTVEEARNNIRGEKAAKIFYNKPAITVGAGIFGVAASLLSFYSLPVPMLYGVVVGRFNPPKMQIPANYDSPYSTTEAYRYGYNKKARNIKIQRSLKWGYIGLGAGLAGLIIYGASNPTFIAMNMIGFKRESYS